MLYLIYSIWCRPETNKGRIDGNEEADLVRGVVGAVEEEHEEEGEELQQDGIRELRCTADVT